jgi:hypothetical protein
MAAMQCLLCVCTPGRARTIVAVALAIGARQLVVPYMLRANKFQNVTQTRV